MGQAEVLPILQYSFSDMLGSGQVSIQVSIRQNEREFFAAVTGHQGIRSLNVAIQQFRQGVQATVSDGVTITIIIGFEVVYIC
jgi:hypothetical protein